VGKAIGVDNLPNMVLKHCAKHISKSLELIFNLSLREGKLPKVWKSARVVPIFKKGDNTLACNYRPVSLLIVTSKILEKCILKKVVPKFQGILTVYQHGFMAGRSTTTQLLEAYNIVNNILDSNEQCDVAYLDFSKAFDSVSHKLLIHKLYMYGIRSNLLSWFEDYLTNRSQHVVVNGANSDQVEVTSGVPQGSILGPFLFTLYINDMVQVIENPCKLFLFADDAKILARIRNAQDFLLLQANLENLFNWSVKWKLNFNIKKCKIMTIASGRNMLMYDYYMGGSILERVNSFKDLGILVDNKLSWVCHITELKAKAFRNLGFIKRVLGPRAPLEVKKLLYIMYVRSILLYCSQVWSPWRKSDLCMIESVQRQATKYLTNYRDMSYVERLRITHLLPLSYVRELFDIIFFYNLAYGRLNVDLDRYYMMNRQMRRGRSVETNFGILVRRYNTHKASNFFTSRAYRLWINLPHQIKSIKPPLNVKSKPIRLKKELYKFYFEKTFRTFNVDNQCTWVSVCQCKNCRPN
jgi:hypothetical protein